MLTALSDERIDAVAAIFPEGIAARQVMKHTYRTYGGRWPLAFHPYYQLGIDRRIETPAFDKLMQIEDPIEYPPWPSAGGLLRRSISSSPAATNAIRPTARGFI